MKVCRKCRLEKPLDKFYRKQGNCFQQYCKECTLKIQTDRWKARKLLAFQLLGGCCSQCGYRKNIAAIDFHHVTPETKEGCWGVISRASWDKVVEELKKCVALCKNCHAEHHNPACDVSNLIFGESDANRILNRDIPVGPTKTGGCQSCGAEVFGTKFCSRFCRAIPTRKVLRPSKEELQKDLGTLNWSKIGRKYGVSDNAVRKWAKAYNLPRRAYAHGEQTDSKSVFGGSNPSTPAQLEEIS